MLSGSCQRHAELAIMTARLLCSVDTLRSPVIRHPRKSLMLRVGSLPSLSFACTALTHEAFSHQGVSSIGALWDIMSEPSHCHRCHVYGATIDEKFHHFETCMLSSKKPAAYFTVTPLTAACLCMCSRRFSRRNLPTALHPCSANSVMASSASDVTALSSMMVMAFCRFTCIAWDRR